MGQRSCRKRTEPVSKCLSLAMGYNAGGANNAPAIAWLAAVQVRSHQPKPVHDSPETGDQRRPRQTQPDQKAKHVLWPPATHDILTMQKITKFDMQFIKSVQLHIHFPEPWTPTPA